MIKNPAPVAGSIGNSGRNAFRGPRYFNVDVSLVKKFAITEKHYVQFQREDFHPALRLPMLPLLAPKKKKAG